MTPVVVAAKDAGGAALAEGLIFLKFQRTTGGGSADVDGTPVTGSWQPFIADSQGRVTVSYRLPSDYPAGGRDVLTASNAKSSATSTKTSSYFLGTTAHYRWSPEPTAAPGSLGPSAGVLVTVTSVDTDWQPVPFAQTCLKFLGVAGGGAGTVDGVALSSTYRCFVADVDGQVDVVYTTPAVLPLSGTDMIYVRDAAVLNTVASFHGYSFGALHHLAISPSPIALAGTLKAGATVNLVVTPLDAFGNQVAGATLTLALESLSGATAKVTNYAVAADGSTLDATPRQFTSHTTTKMMVAYRVPTALPVSGTDRIIGRALRADGAVDVTAVQYSY